MKSREDKLLKSIIELYIAHAKPIGSKVLLELSDFDVSSATIRNDMMALENRGLIAQPHTSAGRVPTIAGYRYYLDNLLSIINVSQQEMHDLKSASKNDLRDLAKILADKSNLATAVSFSPTNIYVTGLYNLFSQPEFEDYKMVLSMSQVMDTLAQAMEKIHNKIKEPTVLLGNDNPFSQYCSVVASPLPSKNQELIAIFGPWRLDYNRVLGLLHAVNEIYN